MKTQYIVLIFTIMILFTACKQNKKVQTVNLINSNFDSHFEFNQPPQGWQVVIKDGYVIYPDDGINKESKALVMDGEHNGKAAVIAQKFVFNEPMSMRLYLNGSIKTAGLMGESSIYLRVFSNGKLIFQDDLKGAALSGDNGWTAMNINTPRLNEITDVEVGALSIGKGRVWFDEFELISNSDDQIDPVALLFAQESFKLIAEHSFYEINPQNEEQFFKSLKGAQKKEDVYGSIVKLLSQIGDNHASLVPADIAAKKYSESEENNEKPEYGLTPSSGNRLSEVGYIQIPAFNKSSGDATTYISAAHQIYIDEYESAACGWIIDLRGNSGGSMWPMLASISPLIDQGVLGFMRLSPDEQVAWQIINQQVYLGDEVKQKLPFDLRQLKKTIFNKGGNRNLAVLINDNTASSAEAVAISLKAHKQAVFFGEKTAGLTTGVSQLKLDDGSVVNISIAEFLDAQYNEYSDGIEPDFQVENNKAVHTAYKFLLAQSNCEL